MKFSTYNSRMAKTSGVDKVVETHISEKRTELIWALFLQDYTYSEIGRIFNTHRATVFRIVQRKPRDWSPKWIKRD